MEQNFKDSTRASICKYVRSQIEAGREAKGMTLEVLADHSGVPLSRVVNTLLNDHCPPIDEAFMMFTALGIPLDELVAYVNGLAYFQRKAPGIAA